MKVGCSVLLYISLAWFSNTMAQSVNEFHDKHSTMVFLYADWCKFCHKMEDEIFSDDSILNLIEAEYQLVKFNSEIEKDFEFKGVNYRYIPNGINTGYHEFSQFLNGEDGLVVLPSTFILNSSGEVISSKSGYLTMDKFFETFFSK